MVDYSRLTQFEDIEIQHPPEQQEGNGAIKSITITKETKPDGSIARKKETLLTSGKTLVEERILSRAPQSAGLRFLPATAFYACASDILPLRHRPLPSTDEVSKADRHDRTIWKIGGVVLLLLIVLQLFLWSMLRSGQDFDDLFHSSFLDFFGVHHQ